MAAGFAQITFSLDGVDNIRRAYATWGTAVQDLTPVWEEIAADLRADFMLQFIGEGGLFGGKWAPLQASTIEQRVHEGFSAGPILYRTGSLAESLAYKGAANNVEEITPTSLKVGTTDPKAPFHQRGTRRMPRRQVVGLSWNRRSMIVRRIGDFIRSEAAKAGVGDTER